MGDVVSTPTDERTGSWAPPCIAPRDRGESFSSVPSHRRSSSPSFAARGQRRGSFWDERKHENKYEHPYEGLSSSWDSVAGRRHSIDVEPHFPPLRDSELALGTFRSSSSFGSPGSPRRWSSPYAFERDAHVDVFRSEPHWHDSRREFHPPRDLHVGERYQDRDYTRHDSAFAPSYNQSSLLATSKTLSHNVYQRELESDWWSSKQHGNYLRQTHDTLIIWDWDDTIMCSTAINANQVSQYQLPQFERLVEEILLLSSQLGESVVVTNADALWVEASTRQFAPRALPRLQQMPVLSARRKYEHVNPHDSFFWKRETFRDVLGSRRRTGSSGGLNLTVIGDSSAEMEAARTSSQGISPLFVKTIKCKEGPSMEEVMGQLHNLLRELPGIVADERTMRRNAGLG